MSHRHTPEQATQIVTIAAVSAIIGAATAMLVAPRTGKQVRGGLKRRVELMADQAKSRFTNDDLDDIIEAVHERLQTVADEAAAEAKTATDNVADETKTVKKTIKRATKPPVSK